MASETKSTAMKFKPSSQGGSSKSRLDSSTFTKNKILESSSKRPVDSKSRSITTSIKTEVKGKTGSSKTTTKTTTVKTREKKVFSLAGQKYDVPEEREPLRIFYESLSKQIPSSEMAEFWMMEHGLLSPERSRKAYEKKQIRQKQLRMGTPVKSLPSLPPSKPESSKKQPQVSRNGDVKVKKKIVYESDDDDDDFVLSHKRRKGL
ncbi:hypothetical protein U1Q18_021754 [Sarracenia purpurea var. burkii]